LGTGPDSSTDTDTVMPSEKDSLDSDATGDEMKETDPLVADAGGDAPVGTEHTDPLTADQGTDDLLLKNAEGVGHVQMPTEHSHWLRGDVSNGSCTVYVNGSEVASIVGSVDGHIDKDITMHLHPGSNSATFNFMPSGQNSFAELDILESEHNPPIPPLATFDTESLPNPEASGRARSETQSFVFTAH
jgi:hypothetical protein